VLDFRPHTRGFGRLAFSPDGRLLAVALSEGVKLWDVAAGRLAGTLPSPRNGITALAFRADGEQLAVSGGPGSEGAEVMVHEVATGREVVRLRVQPRAAHCVAFSGDGQRLVTGHDDGVKVWELASAKELLNLATTGWIARCLFSRDGHFLAVADREGR